MSSSEKLAYQIIHIDLDEPLSAVTVPEGYSGLAFVIHRKHCPVTFFMEGLPAGSTLTSKDLAARIMRNAGADILRDEIFRQLKKPSTVDPFPSLDIVICTHNRTDQLSRCLQSLLGVVAGEAPGSTRILVIDNAPSDDRTAALVAGFLNVVYVTEPTPGLDFARNRALQESTAELIAYVDDDVTVDRYWLQGIRDAWAINPDAAAFVGPVLPFELETRAQVLLEQMGGFGRLFEPARFGPGVPGSLSYPFDAGAFGSGCNMVFRRQLVAELGGFDDALDTGAPLPGGGDMDMLYRVVRGGHALVREPKMVVYHQHRREYALLRHQMWTWGLGAMTFVTKWYRLDRSQRPTIRKYVLWWLMFHLSRIFASSIRGDRKRLPIDLVIAEICGGMLGLFGEYDRSLRRVAARRRKFA